MHLILDTVLAVSPHTDDVEIGCGATLAKWQEAGTQIYLVALSYGGQPGGAPPGEFSNVLAELLPRKGWFAHTLGIPGRHFPEHRQAILQYLIDISKHEGVRFDAVLCPATWDVHQDHQVVTREVIRAYRQSTILGYEVWPNNVTRSSQSSCVA